MVSYLAWRGEPRGKLADTGAGDCIDCLACVQVCPAGIDIRDGHQLACIDCSLCVDACDQMMARVGRDAGLIRWESFTGQNQSALGQPAEWRPIRPRTVAYAVVMLMVVAVMLTALVMRHPIKVVMQHDRTPLYVSISGDRLRNGYNLKISNQTRKQQAFTLSADGLAGMSLAVAGDHEQKGAPTLILTANADGQTAYHITVALPAPPSRQSSHLVIFHLTSADFPEVTVRDKFFGPEAHQQGN